MAERDVPSPDSLRKHLEDADPDLLRAVVETVVATLISAEADVLCGAAYGERQPGRTNRRNGHHERAWVSAPFRCRSRSSGPARTSRTVLEPIGFVPPAEAEAGFYAELENLAVAA